VIDSSTYAVLIGIGIVTVLMLVLTNRFLSMKVFDRGKMRKMLGSHFSVNFALVPIMLAMINPLALILILFPPIGFVSSNLILHGSLLQPKTM